MILGFAPYAKRALQSGVAALVKPPFQILQAFVTQSNVYADRLVGYELRMRMSRRPTRSAAALIVLATASLGCDPSRADDAAPEHAEDALTSSVALGAWTRLHVRAHGHLRVTGAVAVRAALRVQITDHRGFARGRARPDVTLDAIIEDGEGAALTAARHNSSRDDNGLEPDPIDVVAPATGRVVVDLREVAGIEGDFELRLDGADVGAPPPGLVVHGAGAVTSDAAPTTTRAVLLAGGGPDDDNAMSALVDAGGRGDAVILRMDDTGGAYASYFVERGARAATEIAFDAFHGNDEVAGAALSRLRALADDPWVADRLDRAETLFIAGGNQTKYVDAWHDTRLAAAVDRLVARGGTLGGTSAGMHALAGVVHTPRGAGDSVQSSDALLDPYIAQGERAGSLSLDLAVGPFAIPLLHGLVTDTHWSQRDRLGRSLVFLARTLTDGLRPLGAISLLACDEGVAVLFDAAGAGRVFGGSGAAFLFRPDMAPERCTDNRPLQWSGGVPYERVAATPGGSTTIVLPAPRGSLRAQVSAGGASLP